jgi:hypothetical protein
MLLFIPLLMLILAAINYFSDRYNIYSGAAHHKLKFISFIAGISLAFLFLDILPDIYNTQNRIEISIALVLGLVIFFSIEKFIYQHERFKNKKMRADLERLHSWILFLDNFLLGLVFSRLFSGDILHTIILFLPIGAFNVIQGIALHGKYQQNNKSKKFSDIFLAFSALYGFLFSLLIKIPEFTTLLITSFIAGSFFIIILKETMPSEKRANTFFLILGILFYSILLLLTWLL